jgi:hypothetical protein
MERDHMEDLDTGGRILLKFGSWIGWGGMDWIDLVLDRDQQRVLVNKAMNFQIP